MDADDLELPAAVWNRSTRAVKTRMFETRLTNDLFRTGIDDLADRLEGQRALMVTTPTVAELVGRRLHAELRSRLDVSLLVLPGGESRKTWEQVERICHEYFEQKLDRQSFLLGVGGGVCTDLVTMAASVIRRGVRHVRVPTTLIGQIDAGVGIKGAVNFAGRKNSVGCYYAPSFVLVAPELLRTLPREHLAGGLAEAVKMAVVRDSKLFAELTKHGRTLLESGFAAPQQAAREILCRSIDSMLDELEPNFHEDQTYERLVDFGHTFSPALEAAAAFTLPHGQAVAVDVALSTALAAELGRLSAAERDAVLDLLVDLDLPVWSPWLTEPLAQQSLQDAQLHRGGRVNLVVPDGIGVGGFLREAADIPASALRSALHWLRQSPQARALEAGQAGRFCTTNFERQSAPHRGSEQPDPAVFEISAGCTPSGPAAPTDGEWALVFDVGGTHLRTAVYRHPAEEIAAMHTRPTPNFLRHDGESPGEIRARLLGEMAAAADQVLGKKRPRVVAISFAGPLDAQRRVMAAPTIWGEQEGGPVDLLSELQALWPSARIVLENDVTAAGYRFLRSSADSLGIVTVSSGIGNKVFINGRPVVGPAGRGGEIGHIRVDDSADAPLCNCGGRGHLGAISSGRGVLEFARRTAVDQPAGFGRSLLGRLADGDACRITNPHIVTAFHDLDPFTMDVLRRASRPLAQTLATIHLGIGIERFVIIGGFAMALSDPYRLLLAELAREHCWEMGQNWREMIELGDPNGDCTLIGIGRRAFQFQEEDANGDGGRTGATIQLPEAIRLRAA